MGLLRVRGALTVRARSLGIKAPLRELRCASVGRRARSIEGERSCEHGVERMLLGVVGGPIRSRRATAVTLRSSESASRISSRLRSSRAILHLHPATRAVLGPVNLIAIQLQNGF